MAQPIKKTFRYYLDNLHKLKLDTPDFQRAEEQIQRPLLFEDSDFIKQLVSKYDYAGKGFRVNEDGSETPIEKETDFDAFDAARLGYYGDPSKFDAEELARKYTEMLDQPMSIPEFSNMLKDFAYTKPADPESTPMPVVNRMMLDQAIGSMQPTIIPRGGKSYGKVLESSKARRDFILDKGYEPKWDKSNVNDLDITPDKKQFYQELLKNYSEGDEPVVKDGVKYWWV